MPGRSDVEAADQRIREAIRRTPVLELGELPGVDARVVLKLELLQHAGSFKARGALNNIRSLDRPGRGVCAASGGNHAAAVAWAAQRASVPADLFVPASATPAKIERIRDYGGRIHLVEGFVKEALSECADFAERHGVAQVHPFDTFETVCGAGTLGLELADQVPHADLIVLACGGGGLYAGTAAALDGRVRVQPVEPERCPALGAALEAGARVEVEVGGVAGDALGAPVVGAFAFATATAHGVTPVYVTEEDILAARRLLWRQARVLAEPGASVALAGLLSGRIELSDADTVVVVVSGGNNDTMP